MNKEPKAAYKYRGMVIPEKIISSLKARDYGFVHSQKLGYFFSYETDTFQFHVVDRFASFPLFYCIKNGIPYISENIEDLIPKLDKVEFDSVGFCSTGGLFYRERTELTPFVGIKRIMPGHYLEYKDGKINLVKYWSFLDLKDKPFTGTIDEAAEKLGFLIKQAVKRCYEFDNNCAVHLSGGLDSGVIASLYAGFSKNNVQAYLNKTDDDPMADGTESGFARKYLSHYPNIKLNCFDIMKPTSNSKFSLGNWYLIQSNTFEEQGVAHAAKNGHKIVLTGLGGDELASYRVFTKGTSQLINNDQQAKGLIRFKYGIKIRIKEIIRILIGKKGNPILALRLYSSQNLFSDNKIWCTKKYYKSCKYLLKRPPMTPERYPSTLKYRLEVLSRSWFTIRSDRWNYLGADYDIDFIHPLLDADLVSFAACIPTEFIMVIDERELFKKALFQYIPSDLMEGSKRNYHKKMFDYNATEKRLTALLEKTFKLENSFSATVLNIQVFRKQIKRSLKKLRLLKKYKRTEEIAAIKFQLFVYEKIVANCEYLAIHFNMTK